MTLHASRIADQEERESRKALLLRKLRGQAPAGMSAHTLREELTRAGYDVGDVAHVSTLLAELADETPPTVRREQNGLWYGTADAWRSRPRAPGGNVATPKPERTAIEVRRERILELLALHPDGLKGADVVRQLDLASSSTYNDLMKLQSGGLAAQDHNGLWRAVPTPAPQSRGEPSATPEGTRAEPEHGASTEADPIASVAGGETAQPETGEVSGVEPSPMGSASSAAPTGERQPEPAVALTAPAPQPHHPPSPGPVVEASSSPPAAALDTGAPPEGSGSDETTTVEHLKMQARPIGRFAHSIEQSIDEATGALQARVAELERENAALRECLAEIGTLAARTAIETVKRAERA